MKIFAIAGACALAAAPVAAKRERVITDVPVSITAITGADLQVGFDTETEQYGTFNLQVTSAPQGALRGLRFQGDANVVFYNGESYVDLEAVAVLRGPQGTLFGRSTIGALQVGIPRPAYESYVDRGTFINHTARDETQLVPFLEGVSGYYQRIQEEHSFGVRADIELGDMGFGLSVHDFVDADFATLTLGGSFEISDTVTLGLGAEYVRNDNGNKDDGYFASLTFDFERVDVGLYLGSPSLDLLADNEMVFQANLQGELTDVIGYGVAVFDAGSNYDGHGACLTYRASDDLRLEIGIGTIGTEDFGYLSASYSWE